MLIAICAHACGQKQLILLRRQHVILRFEPGDDIRFKLKNNPDRFHSYVNNLFPNSVKVHQDTIPLDRIERLYFRRTSFLNRLGQRLVIFGAGLFLVDQVNVRLVQGQDVSLDSRVSRITLSTVAIGLPLMLIRKKSQEIKYPYRLMIVEKGSGFYRERLNNH